MSYQGYGSSYVNDYDTIDEVADYTDMQGAASVMNAQKANKNSILQSPTKSLIALWAAVVVLYLAMMYFFRNNLA